MYRLIAFLAEEDAATAVEYSVLLALILMSVIAAIGTLGSESGGLWSGNREAFAAHGFGD